MEIETLFTAGDGASQIRSPPVKVVGLYLVRNEVDLIELNLLHHFETAIDEAIVIDNGSTDGTIEVLASLAQLNESFRAPLALFYLDDHSYKEIADILGLPLGTVQSRIARGKSQLYKILTDNAPSSTSGADRQHG